MTNQQRTTRKPFSPASKEANGPTSPTTPKPAEAGVPEIENRATGIAVITALTKQGIRITEMCIRDRFKVKRLNCKGANVLCYMEQLKLAEQNLSAQ